MSPPLAWLAAIAALVLLWLLLVYNTLVTKRNAVNNAESGVDVQLKKRFDLIPNLVAAVKGYMTHESALLERLTAIRAEALAAPPARCAPLSDEAARAMETVFAAVYSDSQQDARYVLSPALMDRLTQLGRKHRGLRAAFHDGCIALALPDAPAYLRKTSASTAEALAAALLRSISPYVSLVASLDLNTRIWTKE